ncbi:MAG: restriction endonuclease subunit S [Nitrospirae bacterium]|nr:restriction endonuclease subunit S [Nitrospirota bacterium]
MTWAKVDIKAFAEVITGGTPSTAVKEYWENGTIPWLNSGDLNQGIITKPSNFITELGYKNSSARMMPAETVLVALTGATTGVSALLKFEACGNQSVTGILPSKNHDPLYLYHYLRTMRNKILNDAWGGAQKHIRQKYVKDFKIPLPPLSDQIRIATILSKAEALIAQGKESLRLLDELLKSTFLEMFGDPSRNQNKFLKGKIADIVSEVKYGTSKPASEQGSYPYLRMNNISYEGYWDFSSLKYIDITEDEKDKYIVRPGDLIFNRTNSKDLVGKTAVYNKFTEMVIAGYLIRVRVNEKGNPWYLWGYLNSRHGKQTLLGLCRNIVGMANINATEIKNIKILIPPVELQTKFAQIVEKVEALKAHYQASLKELENLYGSLSQRAFNDELDLSGMEVRVQEVTN